MSANGSYFKGWSSTLPYIPSGLPYQGSSWLRIGQVLSVDYKNELGKIRVRLFGIAKEDNDDDINVEAYPVDMNMVKYPLPGELVQLVVGIQAQTRKSKFTNTYYYISVLATNRSITFNSDPYIGRTLPANIAELTYFTPDYNSRFEKKLQNFDSFISKTETGNVVKNKPSLKPSEGDIIVQGRFGSRVRLGSTSVAVDLLSILEDGVPNEWSERGGAAGDPIMILSTDRATTDEITYEQSDETDSIVYVSSQQTIPVSLSTSAQLKSHIYLYNIADLTTNDDQTDFMETKPEPPQLSYPIIELNLGFSGSYDSSDFGKLVGLVIDNFEGGYFHPKMLQDGRVRDSRYAGSGETMFGIDRKTGGTLNTSPAGKQFWALIDAANAANTWPWNHFGGNLAPQLKELVGQMMEPHYTSLLSRRFSQAEMQVINSDPRLVMHFVYASWNGSGWFAKFASDVKKAIQSGIVDKDQLAAITIKSRTEEGLREGSSPNSLIAQGGRKMEQLYTRLA